MKTKLFITAHGDSSIGEATVTYEIDSPFYVGQYSSEDLKDYKDVFKTMIVQVYEDLTDCKCSGMYEEEIAEDLRQEELVNKIEISIN